MTVMLSLVCSLLAFGPQTTSGTMSTLPSSRVAVKAEIRGADAIEVTISNGTQLPIEAWAYEIVYDTANRKGTRDEVVTDAYPAAATSAPWGVGIIAPGEKRVLRSPVRNVVAVRSVAMTFVQYDDLSYEGNPAVRGRVLRQREQDGRELDTWIDALNDAQKQPPQQAGQHLRNKLETVRRMRDSTAHTPFAAGLDSTVRRALDSAGSQPRAVSGAIDTLRKLFEQQKARALRHLTR